ncbi:MAG: LysR family transcriptional regulator [Ilumatobacteraceae bacterium]|nr:LysR family transcriptional regulator [Ilumatobacteraceae bacterium]
MELHHLRSFVATARLGSFNAAAHQLSYTGPAIAQHVAALERELGVELLTRHPRGVTPTVAGEVLHDRARHLLDLADGVAHEVRLTARAPSTVRIGAFSTAAQFLLPPVLTSVLTARPGLELVLIDREPPDGFADVVAGRLDVMVTHAYSGSDVSVPPPLAAEPLLRDDLVLLVPTAHWAADGVALSALAGERWVSGPPDAQNQVALEWAARAAGFVPDVAFETTDYAVTMTLVANGLGPAFVPRLIVGSAPAGVREVTVTGDRGLHRMISIVHRDPVRSDTVALVIEELRARVSGPGKMQG